jgi:hypothetical protein
VDEMKAGFKVSRLQSFKDSFRIRIGFDFETLKL